MKSETWKIWGATLKEKRVASGLTQEKLAEKVGLDSKSISRYENGESTKGSTIKLLADAVNWDFDDALTLAYSRSKSSDVKRENNTHNLIHGIQISFPSGSPISESIRRSIVKNAKYYLIGLFAGQDNTEVDNAQDTEGVIIKNFTGRVETVLEKKK